MLTTNELRAATTLPPASQVGGVDAWKVDFFAVVERSEQPLIPCYLVILNIRNILNGEKVPLAWLTREYVLGALLPIFNSLSNTLNLYKENDEYVVSVLNNIRNAEVHLNTALWYFENDMVYEWFDHLSLAGVELNKALGYIYRTKKEIDLSYPELLS